MAFSLCRSCNRRCSCKALFNDEWENYVAQAGCVATLGPPGDLFTADWMSERCGVTTILQTGFNLGDSINTGDGVNAGTGTNGRRRIEQSRQQLQQWPQPQRRASVISKPSAGCCCRKR